MTSDDPRQIECLACSSVRVVFGTDVEATGACPECGYVGWTYAADLDWKTHELIVNGLLSQRS
jgi:hypothetical protein